ncbi:MULTISPECIES: lipase family protein [unclassified Nocardioides]|uniref:lipase family protein n=1 Tax=unclassified Nocardioides TaxID=2615069 RepID=UPI0009E81B42|nr:MULTISPECIES: lipase family protein [unclassified Nocardioides]
MAETIAHADDVSPDDDTVATGRPLRPRDDPFHDAPPNLGALADGTVIRSRRVRLGFLGLVPQRGLTAWQLAHRSNDLDGKAEVAVTTVLVPRGYDPTRPQRVIAYQCAIDAISDKCFPSYALRQGARSWGALPQFELLLISGLLDRGFVVSLSDHEGRGGHFAAPREPGHRVLDGIRAVLRFEPLGLAHDTPVGIFGYSGGGMASAWAAELAPSYAPELRVVGAVLGSPVGDPGEAFIKLNTGLNAGLPALVVSGLRHVYPGLARVIRQHASAGGQRRLDALGEMTTVSAVLRYAFDDFDDYLDAPLADVLALPEVLALFDDLRLGKNVPACPLLVVQAVHDQVIDKAEVDAQVAKYVDGGADVRYLSDRLSEHISLMVLAMPTMLGWLEDRFEGAEVPTGSDTTFSVALSPRAWIGYARMLASAARATVGRAG